MTRTEQEQRETIERLLQLWAQHPQLRLAQLILNPFTRDFYYLEDTALLEKLEQFYQPEEQSA